MTRELAFEDVARSERDDDDPALIVDVDGFEGPLDLLLELARRQKVDLTRISILALAEQYLGFVEEARRVRLELAADYLVMAAWLAYLKSRLLLPEPPKGEGNEPSAADLATALALRLRRLEAMREAAKKLAERPQLGREFFARGQPEAIGDISRPQWEATLYDLLSAYARQRMKNANARVTLRKRFVWSLVDAREALERLVGVATNWTQLDDFLVDYAVDPGMKATVRASAFSATLEMVREGLLDLQQDGAFTPLWVRKREKPDGVAPSLQAKVDEDAAALSGRGDAGHDRGIAQGAAQEDAQGDAQEDAA
ncbi:segregation and condensation protein A [Chelatococcus asaccharovorans]|uniref:Segregation and condensation protein A n=1 Tax=Chelatococcus asaccharovorans TaxID=28210 RepID=A0A2V3U7P9_9HYPH|nr:ScpA family protein [Chelatococcus asaccharovorans]MBS7703957.1 segregation/condensation protein A [Chelatococcus asaccharovorans]PXW58122.1 condensin subunit ScpA [Chelatococcus asaccharovorans]